MLHEVFSVEMKVSAVEQDSAAVGNTNTRSGLRGFPAKIQVPAVEQNPSTRQHLT